MIKVLFLCHGNICRSPMAEFVMKHEVAKLGLSDQFEIYSKALSSEEIGNGIHYGTRAILEKYHIPYDVHYASKMTKKDYEYYDHIYLMDESNQRLIRNIVREDGDGKISLLLEHQSIADPWYSGDFEATYADVVKGVSLRLKEIVK